MSYFLFGAVRIDPECVSDLCQLSRAVARAALARDLFVLAGPNITQRDITRVLHDRGLNTPGCMPFVLTSSPVHDTSEDLLSPLESGTSDIDYLHPRLMRVAAWITLVLAIPGVSGLELLTSEGYDTSYAELRVPPGRFAEELVHRVRAEYDVPSLHFHFASG